MIEFTIFAVALGILCPFLTILALNTLGMDIPYTFGTWLAALWLQVLMVTGGG